jgi:ribosome biogenesis GTPase
VEQAFGDIEALAAECDYPNCSHSGESGCAIEAAIADGRIQSDRVGAWRRLTAEQAPSETQSARSDIAERKRRKAAKFEARRASRT